MIKPFADRPHQKMQEVLFNPQATGPDIHYYMIRGGTKKTNITVWEIGTVGGEYIKTYGHYHVGKLDETYTILQGEGVVLLQQREIDPQGNPIDDKLKTFYAITVKKGDSVFIPSGMGHLVANTGQIWLVTSDDSPVNFEEADPVSLPGHADYQAVQKMKGFGYYLIEENGKPNLVKNPSYKALPEPIWLTPRQYKQKLESSPSLK